MQPHPWVRSGDMPRTYSDIALAACDLRRRDPRGAVAAAFLREEDVRRTCNPVDDCIYRMVNGYVIVGPSHPWCECADYDAIMDRFPGCFAAVELTFSERLTNGGLKVGFDTSNLECALAANAHPAGEPWRPVRLAIARRKLVGLVEIAARHNRAAV